MLLIYRFIKKPLIRFLLLPMLLLPLAAAAQDIPVRWTEPGWWFANSNDSFTQALTTENDDLHTYGFALGLNKPEGLFSLYYDVYTWRGTADVPASRVDRVLFQSQRHWSLSGAFGDFEAGGGGGLAVLGNLGGIFVQRTFHETFGNYRPIPGFDSYDPYSMQAFAQTNASWTVHAGLVRAGLEARSRVALSLPGWQPLWELQPAVFGELADSAAGQRLRLALRYHVSRGSEGSATRDSIAALAQGWQLDVFAESGPVFYAFSHRPDNRQADGIMGFRWMYASTPNGTGGVGKTADAQGRQNALWRYLRLGLLVYPFLPEYYVHEMSYARFHLGLGLPGWLDLLAEFRNGGAWQSAEQNTEVRLWLAGLGLEARRELEGTWMQAASARSEVFAQLLASAGPLDQADFGALRNIRQDFGFSSWLSARWGLRIYGPFEGGLELGMFVEVCPYFKAEGLPAYAVMPRIGIMGGISSGD